MTPAPTIRHGAWTDEEDAFLRAHYATRTGPQIAQLLGRSGSAVRNRVGILGLKKRLNAGRFKAGGTPWNKGSHYVAGGNSPRTRFQPGNRPHTWQPIGHVRVTKDGYLQRKATDTGYTPHDYVFIHHLVWRMHGNTVPPGHALVFRDGDKRNVDINNLELVTRTELMRRNTIHNYPREIVQLVHLRGAITRQINKRERTTA